VGEAAVAVWRKVPVGTGPLFTFGPEPREMGIVRAGFVNVPMSWPMLMLVKLPAVELSEVASTTRLVAVTGLPATFPAVVRSVRGPTETDRHRLTSVAGGKTVSTWGTPVPLPAKPATPHW